MDIETIQLQVAECRQLLERYNVLADCLAKSGVTIELDTHSSPHGVVGVGRVDARQLSASFTIEL